MPSMYDKMDLEQPIARKEPKQLTIHDDNRIDNYYWFKEKDNPELIKHLHQENAYTEKVMAHTQNLQEQIFQELKGRIKQEDTSVPFRKNGYYYLTRFEEGADYPIYARKKEKLEAEEEILLNVNELAKDHDFYQVGAYAVSPDNQLLAYAEDVQSRRIYTIRFKNLITGEVLDESIPMAATHLAWSNDNQYLFYVVKDPQTLRQYKVMRHKVGTSAIDDVLVFEEKDETYFSFIYKSKSNQFIILGSTQTISQEYQLLDANQPLSIPRLFHPRERGLEYDIDHIGDSFYIRTNWEANNFRIMKTAIDQTNREFWQPFIDHREDVLVEGLDLFQNFMVISERIKGISQIRIKPWKGPEHYIDFPEDAFLAYTSSNYEIDAAILRLGYQSLTTPPSVFDYDMENRTLNLLKEQEVLGGFDRNNYASERIFATARDGKEIPISIVYQKGFERNGDRPLLLYGYGSYGHSMEPYFSANRLSLLDRGFVYAIAHIRGGEELGRSWYDDGRLLNKKNTFQDFIDCASHLITHKYTNRDQLFAMGGSAGGLLMGAVMNLRPDLWRGIVAAVPFVDVVTTMLDDSIPLTTFEYDEWGNPNDKTFYDYIKSYSPYDNVTDKAYPALLVTTGFHDSQVQYWEPAKWVAKLREFKTDRNPLLFHINMEAGHGGASGRFRRLKEIALEYSFILDLADIKV